MRMQRFLAALVWCWGAGLLLTAIAIAVEKYAQQPIPGPDWAPFAVAGGIGLAVAGLIAALTGASRVDAAIAIDRVFHLNDRLATVLTLPDDLRDTPAGRALTADALKHVQDLDIPEKFGLRMPKTAWVPVIPGLIAVGLLFAPNLAKVQAKTPVNAAASAEEKEAIAKQATKLGKTIAKKREEMKNAEFAEAEKLLAEIEKAADKLAKSPPQAKDKAMVELNKLTDQLKERQQQLGSTDQITKQLQNLKDLASDGPADQFNKDLAKGDYQDAAQELAKLQEKLTSGKMTEKEKQALKEQLGEVQKQLEKLANMEQRKKQLEDALKNGAISKEAFEQQMAKLNDQSKDLQKLAQMAQKMAEAQKAMSKGDMQKAAEALGASQQELEEMAKAASELEMLDEAMADLQDAKNGMAGDGMNQFGDQLDGMNQLGQGGRGQGNGNGLGRGRGQGDRPEAPDATSAYSTKVKLEYTKGKAIVVGTGPPNAQMKGESFIVDQEAIEASTVGANEALSNQKIPNNVKKHVLGYFDQIRKGE
jgi:hypothetical protein